MLEVKKLPFNCGMTVLRWFFASLKNKQLLQAAASANLQVLTWIWKVNLNWSWPVFFPPLLTLVIWVFARGPCTVYLPNWIIHLGKIGLTLSSLCSSRRFGIWTLEVVSCGVLKWAFWVDFIRPAAFFSVQIVIVLKFCNILIVRSKKRKMRQSCWSN